MSLKKFLENKDVKEKFREYLKKPTVAYNKNILAEPVTNNYTIVGIAFDYLLRIYIYHSNSQLQPELRLMAKDAMDKQILGIKYYHKAQDLIKIIDKYIQEFLRSGELTDKLLASCLILAQLDLVVRVGVIDESFGEYSELDVEDLRNLINLAIKFNWKCESRCLLNPNFDLSSLLVGGADADLILDDIIIDIKAIKVSGISRPHFDQLFGYYILSRLENMEDIRRLGIYSARYGELLVYTIDDIINESKMKELTEWFRDRGYNDYGSLYELEKSRRDLLSF